MVEPTEFKEMLKGVTAIMVTPYTDEGEVSEERLRNHINFLIEGGLTRGNGAIVTTGSMGECGAMSWEERKKVLEIAIRVADGQVPIVAGCNGTNIKEIVDLAQHAEKVGGAGIMLMSPYYFYPPDEIVLDFYQKVASSIRLGIMLYNNAHIVRKDLSVSLISRLSEIENVVAIKECTSDFTKFIQLVQEVGEKIVVLNGNAESWEPFAKMAGSPGFISGTINFAPQLVMELWRLREKEDFDAAMKLRFKLSPLLNFWVKVCTKYGPSIEPSLLKGATALAGSPVGPVRLPVPKFDENEKEQLKKIIEDLGLIG